VLEAKAFSTFLFFYIFDDILYPAVEDAAKVIYFHGADSFALPQTLNRGTADPVFINQGIG